MQRSLLQHLRGIMNVLWCCHVAVSVLFYTLHLARQLNVTDAETEALKPLMGFGVRYGLVRLSTVAQAVS